MTVSTMAERRPSLLKPAHQAGCEEVLSMLCEHRRSAVVVCRDEPLLDAIGMQLARALRQSPALQVELYLPSSSEELLQRFNGMLERLPINAARSRLNLDQRLRLWVLHMTTREELAEVLLLLRLVQAFPGAGVRLLLLLGEEAAAQHLTAALGTRLHRWVVEREPQEPGVGEATRAATPWRHSDPTPAAEGHEQPRLAARIDFQRWRRALSAGTPRLPGIDRLAGAFSRLTLRLQAAPGFMTRHRRWIYGVGGVTLGACAGVLAWWQGRTQGPGAALAASPVKPVPEIVEFIDRHGLQRSAAQPENQR